MMATIPAGPACLSMGGRGDKTCSYEKNGGVSLGTNSTVILRSESSSGERRLHTESERPSWQLSIPQVQIHPSWVCDNEGRVFKHFYFVLWNDVHPVQWRALKTWRRNSASLRGSNASCSPGSCSRLFLQLPASIRMGFFLCYVPAMPRFPEYLTLGTCRLPPDGLGRVQVSAVLQPCREQFLPS